jgi:hypothetical protein
MDSFEMSKEIEKTLQSIEGIQQVDAPNFLYAKVQAKIAASSKRNHVSIWSFITQPAISFSALLIAVVFNFFAISQLWIHKKKVVSQDRSVETFAKEYDMSIYTVYNKSN